MYVESIKYKFNIYFVEPSDIVFEGLSNILLRMGSHLNIFRLDSIDELEIIVPDSFMNVIIVNPQCCAGNLKFFLNLKKGYSNFVWIALVYSLFKDEILQHFDAVISIFDTPAKIASVLNNIRKQIIEEENEEANQLSDREIEVLKEIVKGLSNREISEKLNISIHTVVSHRKNIARKTGIRSRSALAIFALTNKIISLEEF